MLENYHISHKLRRSLNSSDTLPFLNTGCAAVFMWVCRAAYTILLKYAGIAAVHILFMIANISVRCVMQFSVTGRVRTSFLARTCFYLILTVVQSDINDNWDPIVWHDHHVRTVWRVQSFFFFFFFFFFFLFFFLACQ